MKRHMLCLLFVFAAFMLLASVPASAQTWCDDGGCGIWRNHCYTDTYNYCYDEVCLPQFAPYMPEFWTCFDLCWGPFPSYCDDLYNQCVEECN